MNKPNGQFIVQNNPEDIKNFMSDLKIRKIPGIGGVMESELRALGITTCKQIFEHLQEIYVGFSERT